MKRKPEKLKDALFEGEASTSFRKWNKGISATKTSKLKKCSGTFLGAIMRKMEKNVATLMASISVESIATGEVRMPQKLATSFQNIWKETERLRTYPELFPSEKYEEFFWKTMGNFTKHLKKIQNAHEIWSYDNPTKFEVQPIDIQSLNNKRIKFCESCDRLCLLELHSHPLPQEIVEKCGLIPVMDFGFETGFAYIDFNCFDKYDRRHGTFPGPDGNMYTVPRLHDTLSATLQESRLCRWRLQSKCWSCRKAWAGDAPDDLHALEPNGRSARKTWTKWFRNLNQSDSATYSAIQRYMMQNSCTIIQRIPPAAGMLLRRTRFFYNSIGRRYETEHRDKLRKKRTGAFRLAFRLAQATGENYLLLKQKNNRLGRLNLPFIGRFTSGDTVGDVENIESLSRFVRSFQGRVQVDLGSSPLIMEVTRETRQQRT